MERQSWKPIRNRGNSQLPFGRVKYQEARKVTKPVERAPEGSSSEIEIVYKYSDFLVFPAEDGFIDSLRRRDKAELAYFTLAIKPDKSCTIQVRMTKIGCEDERGLYWDLTGTVILSTDPILIPYYSQIYVNLDRIAPHNTEVRIKKPL